MVEREAAWQVVHDLVGLEERETWTWEIKIGLSGVVTLVKKCEKEGAVGVEHGGAVGME